MKTIYTAIFGKYDDLKEPFVLTTGWRYVVFTDQDLKSDVWEVIKVPVMDCGPAKTARYYKIMFHKHIKTEFSIWVDATFIINCNLNRWWRRFKPPITLINHPFDDCCYKDADSCIRLGRGDAGKIRQQLAFYIAAGVPRNGGLISSGILMRQRNPDTIAFCRSWWNQVECFSDRDQIAYGFANHFVKFKRHYIDWNYQELDEFIHIPHLHKKWRVGRLEEVNQKYGKVKGD